MIFFFRELVLLDNIAKKEFSDVKKEHFYIGSEVQL